MCTSDDRAQSRMEGSVKRCSVVCVVCNGHMQTMSRVYSKLSLKYCESCDSWVGETYCQTKLLVITVLPKISFVCYEESHTPNKKSFHIFKFKSIQTSKAQWLLYIQSELEMHGQAYRR